MNIAIACMTESHDANPWERFVQFLFGPPDERRDLAYRNRNIVLNADSLNSLSLSDILPERPKGFCLCCTRRNSRIQYQSRLKREFKEFREPFAEQLLGSGICQFNKRVPRIRGG